MENQDFETALAAFVAYCNTKLQAHYEAKGLAVLGTVTIELERGKRYIRLVKTETGSVGRSSYGFVDQNGDILKAASWKTPAKGARGSIYTPDNYGVGPYGVHSNRGFNYTF